MITLGFITLIGLACIGYSKPIQIFGKGAFKFLQGAWKVRQLMKKK
jgi:hypothetical protein